jgi:hypothetical protein
MENYSTNFSSTQLEHDDHNYEDDYDMFENNLLRGIEYFSTNIITDLNITLADVRLIIQE